MTLKSRSDEANLERIRPLAIKDIAPYVSTEKRLIKGKVTKTWPVHSLKKGRLLKVAIKEKYENDEIIVFVFDGHSEYDINIGDVLKLCNIWIEKATLATSSHPYQILVDELQSNAVLQVEKGLPFTSSSKQGTSSSSQLKKKTLTKKMPRGSRSSSMRRGSWDRREDSPWIHVEGCRGGRMHQDVNDFVNERQTTESMFNHREDESWRDDAWNFPPENEIETSHMSSHRSSRHSRDEDWESDVGQEDQETTHMLSGACREEDMDYRFLDQKNTHLTAFSSRNRVDENQGSTHRYGVREGDQGNIHHSSRGCYEDSPDEGLYRFENTHGLSTGESEENRESTYNFDDRNHEEESPSRKHRENCLDYRSHNLEYIHSSPDCSDENEESIITFSRCDREVDRKTMSKYRRREHDRETVHSPSGSCREENLDFGLQDQESRHNYWDGDKSNDWRIRRGYSMDKELNWYGRHSTSEDHRDNDQDYRLENEPSEDYSEDHRGPDHRIRHGYSKNRIIRDWENDHTCADDYRVEDPENVECFSDGEKMWDQEKDYSSSEGCRHEVQDTEHSLSAVGRQQEYENRHIFINDQREISPSDGLGMLHQESEQHYAGREDDRESSYGYSGDYRAKSHEKTPIYNDDHESRRIYCDNSRKDDQKFTNTYSDEERLNDHERREYDSGSSKREDCGDKHTHTGYFDEESGRGNAPNYVKNYRAQQHEKRHPRSQSSDPSDPDREKPPSYSDKHKKVKPMNPRACVHSSDERKTDMENTLSYAGNHRKQMADNKKTQSHSSVHKELKRKSTHGFSDYHIKEDTERGHSRRKSDRESTPVHSSRHRNRSSGSGRDHKQRNPRSNSPQNSEKGSTCSHRKRERENTPEYSGCRRGKNFNSERDHKCKDSRSKSPQNSEPTRAQDEAVISMLTQIYTIIKPEVIRERVFHPSNRVKPFNQALLLERCSRDIRTTLCKESGVLNPANSLITQEKPCDLPRKKSKKPCLSPSRTSSRDREQKQSERTPGRMLNRIYGFQEEKSEFQMTWKKTIQSDPKSFYSRERRKSFLEFQEKKCYNQRKAMPLSHGKLYSKKFLRPVKNHGEIPFRQEKVERLPHQKETSGFIPHVELQSRNSFKVDDEKKRECVGHERRKPDEEAVPDIVSSTFRKKRKGRPKCFIHTCEKPQAHMRRHVIKCHLPEYFCLETEITEEQRMLSLEMFLDKVQHLLGCSNFDGLLKTIIKRRLYPIPKSSPFFPVIEEDANLLKKFHLWLTSEVLHGTIEISPPNSVAALVYWRVAASLINNLGEKHFEDEIGNKFTQGENMGDALSSTESLPIAKNSAEGVTVTPQTIPTVVEKVGVPIISTAQTINTVAEKVEVPITISPQTINSVTDLVEIPIAAQTKDTSLEKLESQTINKVSEKADVPITAQVANSLVEKDKVKKMAQSTVQQSETKEIEVLGALDHFRQQLDEMLYELNDFDEQTDTKAKKEKNSIETATSVQPVCSFPELNVQRIIEQYVAGDITSSLSTDIRITDHIHTELLCVRPKTQVATEDIGDLCSTHEWTLRRNRLLDCDEAERLPIIDTLIHMDSVGEKRNHIEIIDDLLVNGPMPELPVCLEAAVATFCHGIPSSDEMTVLQIDKRLSFAYGIHPKDAAYVTPEDIESVKTFIENDPRCVGIGELGLEFSTEYSAFRDQQVAVLKDMLSFYVTKELFSKVLMIHCSTDSDLQTKMDASDMCLAVMSTVLPSYNRHNYRIHRHCFNGGIQETQKWQRMFPKTMFGFSALILYKERHPEVDQVMEALPLECMVLESDSPDIKAPEHWNSPYNSPYGIVAVAKRVAQLKGLAVEDVLGITSENARQLYGLNK